MDRCGERDGVRLGISTRIESDRGDIIEVYGSCLARG